MKRNLLYLQRGFTLLELMVVVAIIAILAAVIVINLNTARAKTSDTRIQQDVRNMSNALDIYLTTGSPDLSILSTNGVPESIAANSAFDRIIVKQAELMTALPRYPGEKHTYRYSARIVGGDLEYLLWGKLNAGDQKNRCFVSKNGSMFVTNSAATNGDDCGSETTFTSVQ